MFDNFFKSIFVRILCSIFAALLIGLVCIFTGSHIIEKESSNKLKYLTENQTHKIEASFEIMHKITDNLSYIISNLVYTKNKGDFTYNNHISQIDTIINKFSKSYNNIIGVYIYLKPEYRLEKNQSVYYYAKLPQKESLKKLKIDKNLNSYLNQIFFNNKKIDNYSDFLKITIDDETTSHPYIDKISGIYAVSYMEPITVNNKTIGVVVLNISIANLVKTIPDLKAYNKENILLINDSFCFISSSKKNETSKNFAKNNKLLLSLLTEKIKKENNGIISYKQNGVEMVSSFSKLEKGFIYVITAPKNEVFKQKYLLQKLITRIILMGFILIILITLNI